MKKAQSKCTGENKQGKVNNIPNLAKKYNLSIGETFIMMFLPSVQLHMENRSNDKL